MAFNFFSKNKDKTKKEVKKRVNRIKDGKKSKKSASNSKKVKSTASKSKPNRSIMKQNKNELYEQMLLTGLRARMIIEIVGKPESYVTQMLKEIRDKIKKYYLVRKSSLFKPKEKDGVLQGFLEVDVYFKNIEEFTHFIHTFYPSSVEIIEGKLDLSIYHLNSIFNDHIMKLHELGYALKDVKSQLLFLKEELAKVIQMNKKLIENLILVTISNHKSLTKEKIMKYAGLQGDISVFLDELIKAKKLIQEGNEYRKI